MRIFPAPMSPSSKGQLGRFRLLPDILIVQWSHGMVWHGMGGSDLDIDVQVLLSILFVAYFSIFYILSSSIPNYLH